VLRQPILCAYRQEVGRPKRPFSSCRRSGTRRRNCAGPRCQDPTCLPIGADAKVRNPLSVHFDPLLRNQADLSGAAIPESPAGARGICGLSCAGRSRPPYRRRSDGVLVGIARDVTARRQSLSERRVCCEFVECSVWPPQGFGRFEVRRPSQKTRRTRESTAGPPSLDTGRMSWTTQSPAQSDNSVTLIQKARPCRHTQKHHYDSVCLLQSCGFRVRLHLGKNAEVPTSSCRSDTAS
jgi:hypothetical protein